MPAAVICLLIVAHLSVLQDTYDFNELNLNLSLSLNLILSLSLILSLNLILNLILSLSLSLTGIP
jgi:hypothetical protein